MSLSDRIHDVHPCDPADYVPFLVEGLRVGMMKPEFAECLAGFADVFDVSRVAVSLSPLLNDHGSRSQAVAGVLETLREQGQIPGWRGELYPVNRTFDEPSLFDMERAASTLFGIRTYGVNLLGYVRDGEQLSMWIARRAQTKETNPGKLDIVVGGGQPVGISLRVNLIKECQEEAAIPESLASRAVEVDATCFCTLRPEGIRDDIHYNYELELPRDFIPKNTDGEVEGFYLWEIEKVMEVLGAGDEFAFDSALAILDFLARHGNILSNDPVCALLKRHKIESN
ncbi:MAG: DUF4743 domain-containing protein [Rhodospirillales bacterium]|jgi:hypothetical protein|nr:DUF4743 domain-containing protein [Rhodospirillales bacterium]